MKIFSFWKRKKLNGETRSNGLLSDIYSEQAFKSIILRERVRCDRNESVFSLITFDLSGKSEKAACQLIKILDIRGIRMIDDVGMVDSQRIGISLHNTDKTGALSFAKTIHERIISSTIQSITYKVYVYPTDWNGFNDKNGDLKRFHEENDHIKHSVLMEQVVN